MKLELKNVSKNFEEVTALNNINLKAEDTELIVLLGPSGCGKSTLLRCVAGLESLSEGKIFFDGKEVNDVKTQKRDVGFVFQDYALYPHMNVFENISTPLKVRGKPESEIKEKVEEIASLLEIENLLSRKPKELSGGQQQRVALARAIIRNPKLFLLDEPLSNLDAKLRKSTRVELRKLQKELKTTTIYVTHDQEEAMAIADRLVVLKNGKIHQIGNSDELYNTPNDLFVAGFIGSVPINKLECTLETKSDRIYLNSKHFQVSLSERLKKVIPESYVGQELIFAIRPTDISISSKESSQKFSIEGKTSVIEELGEETIINVEVGEHQVKAVADPNHNLKRGEKIWLIFNENSIYLFDKKTGENIIQ